MKRIAATLAAFALTATPVLAAAAPVTSDQPVKIADQELDQVTAGAGSLLDLKFNLNVMLQDIALTVNVSNVPINAAVAVQASVLGQAIQTATVMAGQQVTQAQTFAPIR